MYYFTGYVRVPRPILVLSADCFFFSIQHDSVECLGETFFLGVRFIIDRICLHVTPLYACFKRFLKITTFMFAWNVKPSFMASAKMLFIIQWPIYSISPFLMSTYTQAVKMPSQMDKKAA
jgi:hypothetical protein